MQRNWYEHNNIQIFSWVLFIIIQLSSMIIVIAITRLILDIQFMIGNFKFMDTIAITILTQAMGTQKNIQKDPKSYYIISAENNKNFNVLSILSIV